MVRRRTLLAGTALSATTVLAGCGFALRRAPELRFSTLALTGFAPRSEMATALRRELARTSVRLVESATGAQVVLEVLEDRRQRSVVATTSAAQVRELQLRQRLRFRVRTPDGTELLAPALIALSRDMSTSETQVLAKEQEEAQLFDSMTADIVQQVLQRLAAIRLP